MTRQHQDRLGLTRDIPRRDFLGGALAAASVGALPGAPAPQDVAGYDPPRLTGLRGSHPGSFEAAHALRDGDFWQGAPPPVPGDEHYDLIIVGGGISGLSAAYFYRQKRPPARILILENHDDFGGHAKRNEFTLRGGRLGIMGGGTLEIDSPRPYSRVADGLLRALGIDPPALKKACTDESYYTKQGLSRGLFLDQAAFGRDALLPGLGTQPWSAFFADSPLPPALRDDVTRVYEGRFVTGRGDAMPGLSSAEKKDRLSRISYADYMLKHLAADPAVLPVFQALTHDEWGVGIDAVSALDAWGFGLPGFDGLKLAPGSAPRMGFTASGYADGESYSFRFPDGNASIARMLMRALVPAAMPGHTAEDSVLAPTDYAKLDAPGNAVRIRLSSIVVGVRNKDAGVQVAYWRQGKVRHASARACVLACWNMMIPYLCPEMPAAQKDALHYLVKVPLVYCSVALASWQAFRKARVSEAYAPASYFPIVRLALPTNIGGFSTVAGPEDPVLVQLIRTPCQPGLTERDQHRAGRTELLATPFETFEYHIRDQLGRMLGPSGFDPARDITAITVNRWPHGYAYEYNPLFDPEWAPGQAPHEIGRKRFGNIVIANSDSGAGAYTDMAIDQAWRAVRELG